MNVENLLKYFGLPATNREFDDFLSAQGVEERRVYDPSSGIPFERIEVQESGFSMEFIRPGEYTEDFGPVRESGELIFAKIFLHLVAEDDYKAYSGALPDVFPDSMSPDTCLARFGQPDFVRDENDDFGQENNVEYTWDRTHGYSIFVRFIKAPPATRHVVIAPARV